MPIRDCPAYVNLEENMKEIDRLVQIHEELTGTERGRRHGYEVINKSGIVLVSACWEAFLEDLVTEGFNILVDESTSSGNIPRKLKSIIGKELKEDKNDLNVWLLSDSGWKNEMKKYKENFLKNKIDYFNSPRPEKVDGLFEYLLGLKCITENWKWQKKSNQQTKDTLNKYLDIRGEIAHRVSSSKSSRKSNITKFKKLIIRLAALCTNQVNSHLKNHLDKTFWNSVDV